MFRIDKQKTLELYMQEINEMAELMDWVDSFTPGTLSGGFAVFLNAIQT